jgi:hypothetical protein
MSEHSAAVQRLIDLQEIRDCLNRYARGLDRHDEELLASAYHPDALDHHGPFVGDIASFVQWANELHESAWAAHSHYMVNNDVEFDGDVAHSEAYVLFVLRRKDGERLDFGGGRYLDRFERRDGEWRIAQRQLVVDWFGETSAAAHGNVTQYPMGTWDRSDPSYQRPFALPTAVASVT